MLRHTSVLVSLVLLVDRLPWPPEPPRRPRGHPKTYSDRLIVKALVIMIIRRLYTAYTLLAFLDQDDPLPQQLRPLLCEHGRFPSRRTWERRRPAPQQSLPRVIWCSGGVWHTKHRGQGVMPQSSIETAAGWSRSGWHGWWYGWQLPLAVTVGALWLPWAAALTVANR